MKEFYDSCGRKMLPYLMRHLDFFPNLILTAHLFKVPITTSAAIVSLRLL